MEKNRQMDFSELAFSSSEAQQSRAIRDAIKSGELRKIAPRIYSSNLASSPADIIAKNRYQIISHLYPGAVVSHRSALEGGAAHDGSIVLTYRYTKNIKLPGLTIRLIEGVGAQPDDMPFMDGLFLASQARAFLENMQPSRSGKNTLAKTLSQIEIEEKLMSICHIRGEVALNDIRDRARVLSEKINLTKEYKKLEKIISAILGSHEAKALQSQQALAKAQGEPFDRFRLELFSNLFTALASKPLPQRQCIISSDKQLRNLAFFESYFSNYIEGTEFEVDEAADIIFQQKIMANRPEDSHDILGTFQIVGDDRELQQLPHDFDKLIELLSHRHQILMSGRKQKRPGKFKELENRAGNTLFVKPELVRGTLRKGLELYHNLHDALAKAIFMMFMVAEVHPFDDGNGRIARIMMNAELATAHESRIIIPTVYREDYLLALRQFSRQHDPEAYINMLIRAQAFTISIDFSDYKKALQQLKNSNAFVLPSEGKLEF